MAALYGEVEGAARTRATRTGHYDLWTRAASWEGGVEVFLDKEGNCRITLDGGNASGRRSRRLTLWEGNLHEIGDHLVAGPLVVMRPLQFVYVSPGHAGVESARAGDLRAETAPNG